jgi:pimeloyl-ACP methyl ester carboxylesterase
MAGRAASPPFPYTDTGSGHPVILVHGLLSGPDAWSGVGKLLARRWRVISCDLRRLSANRDTAGRCGDRPAALLALLDFLGLRNALFAAHGSGCPSVTALACQVPHRVRGLALVDPILPRAESSPSIQETWHAENLLEWLTVGYGSAVRRPEHATVIRNIVAQQTHARMDGPGPAGSPAPAGLAASGGLVNLHSLTCPVLTLTGQQAPVESKAMATTVFGEIPRMQWLEVMGAGRRCPREAPEAVARLLEPFLLANA